MAYYDFLNIVFAPLLKLPALWTIIILSLLISLIIILITKYTTDQALMKNLKEEIKSYQKQIKELKNEPSKAMEIQKKSMEVNMKYMMHSLKPTLITFIPIILIFGWMSSTFAYEGIKPQQEFSITANFDRNADGNAEISVPDEVVVIGDKTQKIENSQATWTLKGEEGEHLLEVIYNDEKQQHSVLITDESKYLNPVKKTNGLIKSIQANHKKRIVLPIGYKDWFGWLGTYIIFSLAFTMI
ncbi:DUF106 domain-containing protein, partial [Candidatus Woesearchaeota archaeon]|nr:DUF106 domain-containing protein [Candidatus Woesearchaeota archaeon]